MQYVNYCKLCGCAPEILERDSGSYVEHRICCDNCLTRVYTVAEPNNEKCITKWNILNPEQSIKTIKIAGIQKEHLIGIDCLLAALREELING